MFIRTVFVGLVRRFIELGFFCSFAKDLDTINTRPWQKIGNVWNFVEFTKVIATKCVICYGCHIEKNKMLVCKMPMHASLLQQKTFPLFQLDMQQLLFGLLFRGLQQTKQKLLLVMRGATGSLFQLTLGFVSLHLLWVKWSGNASFLFVNLCQSSVSFAKECGGRMFHLLSDHFLGQSYSTFKLGFKAQDFEHEPES